MPETGPIYLANEDFNDVLQLQSPMQPSFANDFSGNFAKNVPNLSFNSSDFPSTSTTATNSLFSPRVDLDTQQAAERALNALSGALKRDINFKAIPEPAKTHTVNQLAPIYFHNQHCAWVDRFAKGNGELPNLQSHGDIQVERDLLQQHDLLYAQHLRFVAYLPTQSEHDTTIADHLAISRAHSQMLLAWAFQWDTKPDDGMFIVGLGNDNGAAALQGTQVEGVENLDWMAEAASGLEQAMSFEIDAVPSLTDNSGWATMPSASNETVTFPAIQSQVTPPPTSAPHSTADNNVLHDAPNGFAASAPATTVNAPQKAKRKVSKDTQGGTGWNGHKPSVNNMFRNKPIFNQPVADESTPIDTILRDFPNHIKFIGTRLKNNKEWSNDRIARILVAYGHESIFDGLEEEVKVERLSQWVRARRACGTQKDCQAKKKSEN